MLKTKKRKSLLVAVVIFSLIAVYGSLPTAKAAITDAKDTISDSDFSPATATHVFTFTTGTQLAVGDYISIVFPGAFTGVDSANATCPANTTASDSGNEIICTIDPGQTLDPGPQTVTVTSVTNPVGPANSYAIDIVTYDDAGPTEIESTQVMVYIIDDVTVSATVNANLTFEIEGLADTETVNGVNCDVTTDATTAAFGTLTYDPTTVCQQLKVSTNADDGFTVTVQQTSELVNAGGSNINSFDNAPDGTGSTTPHDWAAPMAVIDSPATYGHMGLTSEDDSFALGADPFGDQQYVGFNGTAPVAVMYHNGPANSTVDGAGITQVAYTVEISEMQEAGDYNTTITYIATPQY